MNKTLNNNATSLLAQYLARENLTVVHNATAQTASIDLANRVLELPTWDTSSVGAQAKPVYHGLVGHEVAHALHTPAKEWVEAQTEIAGVGSSTRARAVAQDFVNVVEDARIEKIIKREFPGLKSDFAHMYDTMWKMDAFQCKAKDLNTMRFIDRLNLHYKVGIHAGVTVPFTDVERETIKRIDRAVSFRDVVDIAKDLYTAAQEEQQDEQGDEAKQSKPEDKKDAQKGKKGQPCDQGEKSEKSEKGESTKSEGESQDSDNQQDAEGDGNGNGSEGEENGEGSQSDGKDGQKSDANADADANDEKSSPDAEKQEIGEGNKSSDHTNADTDIVPYGCTTQQNMSKFVNGLVNVKIDEEPIRVPNIDPTSIVVEPADFIAMVEQGTLYTYYGGGKGQPAPQEIAEQSAALFAEMTAKQKSAVDHMSRRFEMRKAAKDFARQSSCKSGRISTRQLSKYKFSEDIFDRLTIKRDEKNHGIVILLDWSGSMAHMISDVVQQVGGILQFCRRVGIPAEVYFFNSMYNKWAEERFNKMYPAKGNANAPTRPYAIRYGMADSAGFSGMDWHTAEAMAFTDHVCHLPNGSTAKGGNVILSAFSLVKVYDANMDNRKFAATFGRLLLVANAVGSKTMTAAKGNMVFPESLQMGNTPLDESILSMREIVNNFRKSSNSKVTFISMSDGEGQGLTNHYHATTRGMMRQAEKNTKTVTTVLIDGSNGRRYENGKLDHGHCRDKTHSTCVQMFRDATGVEIAGIMMLQGGTSLSYTGMYTNNMPKCADYLAEAAQREKDQKQFQAEDFFAMPVNGYNSYFFINVKSSTQVNHEQIKERKRLESLKNRKTAIEREMILNAEQSQCNRAFINRLMDIVA